MYHEILILYFRFSLLPIFESVREFRYSASFLTLLLDWKVALPYSAATFLIVWGLFCSAHGSEPFGISFPFSCADLRYALQLVIETRYRFTGCPVYERIPPSDSYPFVIFCCMCLAFRFSFVLHKETVFFHIICTHHFLL